LAHPAFELTKFQVWTDSDWDEKLVKKMPWRAGDEI
jgi:hypothetical protein